MKTELAELLAEMRASLPHFGFDAALTATALSRIDELEALLARRGDRLGGFLGAFLVHRQVPSRGGEELRLTAGNIS